MPSHGMRDDSPPKLHMHDTVQLQLSAAVAVAVAVRCQDGVCARDGTTNTVRQMAIRAGRFAWPFLQG